MQNHTEMFPGQRRGEVVKLIVTKHWIIYFRMFRQFIIFALVPLIGLFFTTFDTAENIRGITYFISFMYLSYFFLVVFIRWLDEMLDVLIVTNQRLISIEQVNLFQNAASETNLPMIQDVKGRKKGIFGGLLQYGEMEIQTAAEKIEFRIHDVGDPFTKAKRILDIRDEFIREYEVHSHSGPNPHDANSGFPGYSATAAEGNEQTNIH
ncbi:MAG: hypothetical protein Q8P68_01220 [Candidatus Peregrinibacteria bacterium]|nr:hypothetical protein [Candidatus Peregrinibacteria bacterium]MDZ4244309.1 hypothetical protein [Candidatus Gracilibacteria bacterium]